MPKTSRKTPYPHSGKKPTARQLAKYGKVKRHRIMRAWHAARRHEIDAVQHGYEVPEAANFNLSTYEEETREKSDTLDQEESSNGLFDLSDDEAMYDNARKYYKQEATNTAERMTNTLSFNKGIVNKISQIAVKRALIDVLESRADDYDIEPNAGEEEIARQAKRRQDIVRPAEDEMLAIVKEQLSKLSESLDTGLSNKLENVREEISRFSPNPGEESDSSDDEGIGQ